MKRKRPFFKFISSFTALAVFAALFCSPLTAYADEYDDAITENTSLSGKIIYLDPGHGVGSGGAYAGYVEHVYNLIFANLIKENLEKCGATVLMTRSTSADVNNMVRMATLNKRMLGILKSDCQSKLEGQSGLTAQILNYRIAELNRLSDIMQSVVDKPSLASVYFNSPYDYSCKRVIHPDLKEIFEYEDNPLIYDNVLFLSLHTNATAEPVNESVNGTTTYYLNNSPSFIQKYFHEYTNGAKNQRFAELLLSNVTAAGAFKSCGTVINDYFMLREHNVPAALIEIAFHTSASDRAKLTDPAMQQRIAAAVTISVQQYFAELTPVEPEAKNPFSVESAAFTASDDGITGIPPGTTVQTLLSGLTSAHTVKVFDASGAEKSPDSIVCTGDTVRLYDGGTLYSSGMLVIYGDASGNGEIDLLDLLLVQKHLLELSKLSGASYYAGDASKANGVDLMDLLLIQKYLLEIGDIEQ